MATASANAKMMMMMMDSMMSMLTGRIRVMVEMAYRFRSHIFFSLPTIDYVSLDLSLLFIVLY